MEPYNIAFETAQVGLSVPELKSFVTFNPVLLEFPHLWNGIKIIVDTW